MSLAYDLEADLRALEAMAANLTPYLYEKELFGTITSTLPRLTIGGILLRLHRLEALREHLDHNQAQRLRDARLNFEQARSEWAVHYEGKISQELGSRLRSFESYLEEYNSNSREGHDNYPIQATRRTILHHLQAEAQARNIWDEELADQLRQCDKHLREVSGGEHFIWAAILEPVYPSPPYWWLYSEPIDHS